MSWQAFEAIRDHSKSRGATRTVGFVLASYANAEGGSVFPSLNTIRRGTGARPQRNRKGKLELTGGAGKKTVVDARRWFVDNGEAIITGTRPSHTGAPVPVLDFSPLLAKGSMGQPSKGSTDEPSKPEGFDGDPPNGSLSELSRVRSDTAEGSASEPESSVSSSVNSSDKSSVDQSPFSTENHSQLPALDAAQATSAQQRRQQVEAAEKRRQLEILLSQRPRKSGDLLSATERCIESLRDELGIDAEAELDVHADRLLEVAA